MTNKTVPTPPTPEGEAPERFRCVLSTCTIVSHRMTIVVMEIRKTDEYDAWFRNLRDRQAKARINARIRLCQTAGRPVGDINTIGDGVSELRFHFGPGYRVYFAQKGDVVMLLLAGGDKRT